MISIAEIFDNSKDLLDGISGFVDKYIGKKGRQFRSGDGYYKVLSNGDVTYLKPANKKAESAVVPIQVKKGKYFFMMIYLIKLKYLMKYQSQFQIISNI